MFYNHTVKTFLWKIRIWNKFKHRNIYLTHWSVWFGANNEIHGWLVERLFTEALFDGTGYQENTQQADDDDETDQPATHCWLLKIKNSSAKVAVQIFTAFMWCFLSDQWGNTYIACHLPVVPIHILRTFALADNGSGVSVEPGGVWCEVQRIGRALSRYIYQVTNLWFGNHTTIPMVCSMVLWTLWTMPALDEPAWLRYKIEKGPRAEAWVILVHRTIEQRGSTWTKMTQAREQSSLHPNWCQHLIPVKLLNLAPWGPCAASCSRRLCDKAVPPSHASCKYHWSTLIKSYILRKYLWIIFIEYRPVPVVVLPASMVPVGELWSGFSYLEVQPVSIFWFGQE